MNKNKSMNKNKKDQGVSLKLQRILVNEIDKIIKEHPEFFYRNRTDFIADACRWRLKQLRGSNTL